MSTLRLPLVVAFMAALGACGSFGSNAAPEPDAGAEDAAVAAPCPNGALSFGGNGYVKVDYDTSFDSPAALTVEAWIFVDPNIGSSRAHIVSHHDEANSDGWTLFVEGGALGFRVYKGSGTASAASGTVDEAREDLAPDAWHHVAAVYNGGERSIALFIDGHTKGRTYGTLTSADAYGGPLTIGAAAYLPSNGFVGIIDEVRLSNVARYKPEEAFVPAYPLPDSDAGTVGTWHFLQGKSPNDVAKDARGLFSASLATFAKTGGEFPTPVLGTCPTGARP